MNQSKFFLRRLEPVDGVPRTLVVGVLTGDYAIDGPDDQCVEPIESGAAIIADIIKWGDRGTALLDGATTAGVSTAAVMMGLGRLEIGRER